jgi:hypothetical protein
MSDNKFHTRFSVEIVRSGQPRPYADTEREYKVLCEMYQTWGKPEEIGWHPIPTNEYGSKKIDDIVRGTCQNFYRSEEEPGACWASPILKWMKIDGAAGIIHVFIKEAYTD